MHFVNGRHVIWNNRRGEPLDSMTIARTIEPAGLAIHKRLITRGVAARLGLALGGGAGLVFALWVISDSPLRWIFGSIFALAAALGLLQMTAYLARLSESKNLRHTSRHIDVMNYPRLYPLLLQRLAEEYNRALDPDYDNEITDDVNLYVDEQGRKIFKLILERADCQQVATLQRFFRKAGRLESAFRRSGKPYPTLIDYRVDFVASRAAAQLVSALDIPPARKLSRRV